MLHFLFDLLSIKGKDSNCAFQDPVKYLSLCLGQQRLGRELGGKKEEKTKVPVQLKMLVQIKGPVAFLCQNSNSNFTSNVDCHNHCPCCSI